MTAYTYFMPNTQMRLICAWLKSLDAETLRSYFGFSLNPKGIDHLINKWKREPANHHFLIYHEDDQWAGVLHIAISNNVIEFGVIVKKEFRRQGVADRLLGEAIVWAQNRGYQNLLMHCVVENHAIRRLCDRHQLTIRNIYGDVEAEMSLPRANWRSVVKESIQRQTNWYYLLCEKFT